MITFIEVLLLLTIWPQTANDSTRTLRSQSVVCHTEIGIIERVLGQEAQKTAVDTSQVSTVLVPIEQATNSELGVLAAPIDEAMQEWVVRITVHIEVYRRRVFVAEVGGRRTVLIDVNVRAVKVLVLAHWKKIVHRSSLMTLNILEED